MPELPEVESVRSQLAIRLLGARILSVELRLPRILRLGTFEEVIGCEVTAISRFGKYLHFKTNSKVSLFAHLGMTGQLLWEPLEEQRDRFIRAIIKTTEGDLFYRDVRTLGGFWICASEDFPRMGIGLDPFDGTFDEEYISRRIAGRKTSIKSLLLDQRIIAGIGNIYASEILFLSRIHPARPAGSLSSSEISALHTAIQKILRLAIQAQGTTFRDFRLSDGREGEFKNFLKVYAHENDPCQNCGNVIIRMVQSNRSSYLCPVCQPLNV